MQDDCDKLLVEIDHIAELISQLENIIAKLSEHRDNPRIRGITYSLYTLYNELTERVSLLRFTAFNIVSRACREDYSR